MSLHDSISDSEIKRLEGKLLKAMRSGDLTFFNDVFSEKYVFLGSDGSTWGKEKALEDFKNPQYELLNIEVHDHRIFMHETCAIVTGISIIEGKIGTEQLTGRYQFMRVWNKERDGWKIIAVTTSKKNDVP